MLSHPRLLVACALFSSVLTANVTVLDKDDWKLQIGGFAQVDVTHDTTRSVTEIAGSTPILRSGTLGGENGRTQMSPRHSRFLVNALAPSYEGWKARGFLEYDLLGAANGAQEGGLYTSPTLRMRHAFVSVEGGGWLILGGQAWTLFGWQMTYIPPTVSVPPVTGVVFARTPMIEVIKTLGAFQIGAAANRPAQRDSSLPNFDAGIRFAVDERKAIYAGGPTADKWAAPMSFALTGTVRDFETPAGTGSPTAKNHQTGYAGALDVLVPLIAANEVKEHDHSLLFTAEVSAGQGYGDQFSGYSANLKQLTTTESSFVPTSVNLDAGLGGFDAGGVFKLVKLTTFNVNLQYHLPSSWRTHFNLGYAQIHSSNAASLGPTVGVAYYRNEAFFVDVYHDFTPSVRAAFEYDYFRTKYADGVEPHNHRWQLSGWFRI